MKDFHIILKIDDAAMLKKLTNEKNSMPSWILGEEIAKKIKRSVNGIEINIDQLFLKYNA